MNFLVLISSKSQAILTVGHTRPAIVGITESKLDSSVSDQKVNISGYSILRSDRNR